MANKQRLISLDDALNATREEVYWTESEAAAVRSFLVKRPKVDAVEVVHGRWIPLEYDGYADGNPVWDLWECSECRDEHSGDEDTLTPYCPNCGARMDGE